jgi:ComF family protein
MKQHPLVSSFGALLRERLFPAGCAACGDLLLDGEEAFYGLCENCRPRFAPETGPRCRSCGRSLISEIDICVSCREGAGFSFDGAFSLYPYTGRYQELLRAWKFGKVLSLGNFFAAGLAGSAPVFGLDPGTVWVPVPPRPGKLRRTGWDQIRQLARCLERGFGVTVYPCLKRLPSQSQKELDRAGRQTNLRGRIICVKPPPQQVILFDDVITTGATLDTCAGTLKEAGAETVHALSLFYD